MTRHQISLALVPLQRMEEALDYTDHARGPAVAVKTGLSWPATLVFFTSGCLMVLELVASRIVAPYVGVSLYTWTSVIGVVLAGISLGNYAGGRMADRLGSPRLLGFVLLAGGVATFGALAVEPASNLTPAGWPFVIEIVVLVGSLFFLPAVLLGTVAPIVAKLAVSDLARTGTTVGRIFAAGAAGSILGTFATGFVLIPAFGTHVIVWGAGTLLALVGMLLLMRDRRLVLVAVAVLIVSASSAVRGYGLLTGPCERETSYYCIQVRDLVHRGDLVRVLQLDRLVHSYTFPDHPTRLIYGYEKFLAAVTAQIAETNERFRSLHIGGGGYTFPRYLEASYAGSEIDVIEIDPGVTRTAHDLLGLRADSRIQSYNEDARVFLGRPVTRRYHLIVGDAFNDLAVPYHLTTKEFNERLRAWLAGDGLYLVNLVDRPNGEFARAFAHTLRQTFPHVYVRPHYGTLPGTQRTVSILVASARPVDLPDVVPLDQFFADDSFNTGEVVTLTDEFAPVDQMVSPLFSSGGPW